MTDERLSASDAAKVLMDAAEIMKFGTTQAILCETVCKACEVAEAELFEWSSSSSLSEDERQFIDELDAVWQSLKKCQTTVLGFWRIKRSPAEAILVADFSRRLGQPDRPRRRTNPELLVEFMTGRQSASIENDIKQAVWRDPNVELRGSTFAMTKKRANQL